MYANYQEAVISCCWENCYDFLALPPARPPDIHHTITRVCLSATLIVLGPFCWKCVRVKSDTYTMHSALTGMQVLVTRTPEHAHWLAHFCRGLILTAENNRKATKNSYSDARLLVTFFFGFIMWQQGTCFMFDYDIKEKEHENTRQSDLYFVTTPPRTNQILSCFDAIFIT
jgi:branched-subunit amino acid transport protein AzlD